MGYNKQSLPLWKRAWLSTANIPIRYLGWDRNDIMRDMGKFPVEVDEWLEQIVSGKVIMNEGGLGTTGVGLLFDGSAGMGKTTHAVVSAIEFVLRLPDDEEEAAKILHASTSDFGRKFKAIHYLTYPEFLSMKKASFDAEPDERYNVNMTISGLHGRATDDHKNVRLLILDDLGKEQNSRYNDASFDELLRARYDKGLPTIITTNVSRDDWAVQYGEAMGSFAFEAFSRVRIVSKDLRK
jgi:DNA replication protein DnaC